MICKNLPCIIKNSKDIIYKFWLDSSDNLFVENYTEFNIKNNIKFIYKHSILDYSVDIDDEDTIYIAFITKDGILKYSTLDSPDIEKNISRIPSKDYKIDYVTIKIISSDIHAFYMIQNKYNIDNWSINHSFFQNNSWNSNKLGEISFVNNSSPYSIDFYKNNIYIFYPQNISNNYCIQKFSVSFGMWATIESNILLLNAQNAEMLINNKGIGVICYNSYINKNSNTLLKFKDFNVNSSIWSDDLLVKNSIFDSSLPSMLCRNDALFLFWRESNSLFLVKSFYEPTNLGNKKIMPYKDVINSYKYISNKFPSNTNKNNFLFFTDATPPCTILEDSTIKDFLKADYSNTDLKFNPLNGLLKETLKIIAKNSNLNNKPHGSEENLTIKHIDKENSDDFTTNDSLLDNTLNKDANLNEIEIKQLKNSIALKDKDIEQLKNSLTLSQNELEQFKNSLNLKESEIDNLKSSLSLSQNETAQFQNSLNSKEGELQQLKTSLTLLQNQVVQFQSSLNLKESELQQLQNSFNLSQNEVEQLKNSLNLKESEVEQFESLLTSKESQIEHLEDALNSKRIELQNLTDSYTSIQNLVDEKDFLIQNLHYKIKDLELENENLINLQARRKKSFIDLFKKDH